MSGEAAFSHTFTTINPGKLTDFYTLDRKPLGEGSYGRVTKAQHNTTRETRAIKCIDLSKISDQGRFQDEIAIQQRLDHPNIVKLYEVFKEANKRIYLVMELCTGGELFDKIITEAEKHEGMAFGEKDAATYMRQIMRAIFYLHSQDFVHRDIKPENFLLQHQGRDAEIKVIDFGLAKKFKVGSGAKMKTKAGTPYYVAPQVLQGQYDEKCDIWSCGVILYILLCGYPPFYGDRDDEILRNVKKGVFDFPSPDWDNISRHGAKDLIQQMLTMDPEKRPDANACLNHAWFSIIDSDAEPIKIDIAKRLKSFSQVSKLKKVALTLIAKQLGDKDLKELKATFEAMDANHDGTLTVAEITQGMAKHKLEVPDDLKSAIIAKLDTDGSGTIDYTEFIAATMERQQYLKKEVLLTAFRTFDKDSDGRITKEELEKMLGSDEVKVDPRVAQSMIAEVDVDGDGKLSFDEFEKAMQAASPSVSPR